MALGRHPASPQFPPLRSCARLDFAMLASVSSRPPPMRSFTDAPTPTPPPEGPPPRFPHVRAALNALAKQHKPLETDDDEVDHSRVSNDLLNQIAALLEEEDDEGLQTALKETFGVPSDEVSSFPPMERASCGVVDLLTPYTCSGRATCPRPHART
jgi:hypothetical protein